MIRLASATASAIADTYAGEFLGNVANFLAASIEAQTAMTADFLGSSTRGTIACSLFLCYIELNSSLRKRSCAVANTSLARKSVALVVDKIVRPDLNRKVGEMLLSRINFSRCPSIAFQKFPGQIYFGLRVVLFFLCGKIRILRFLI